MAESIDIIIKAVNQAKATLNEVSRELKSVGTEAKKIDKDTSKQAVAGLKKWRSELDKTKKSVKGLQEASQKIVDVSQKLLIAGVAMGAAVFFPIKQAGEFEAAMASVKAIMTDINEVTFERMKAQARSLGESTRYTATQAAGAFKFLAMAGLDAIEAMEALPGTLQLAAAGGLDLATAADLATNVLAGLGFEVSQLGRVNDVLARAASRSNTSVMELGEAMKIAGPAAKGSNESFEDVVSVLGRLADAGIKGSLGGNAVKRMLILLQNPTKKAKEELERLNVPLRNSEGRFRGLIPILEDLGKAQMDLSGSAKIFGLYTGAAAVAAAGQAKTMGSLSTELKNAKGAAEEMARVMQDTMPGAFTRLRSAVEGFMLSVAEPLMGVLKDLFLAIADIVSMATALIKATGPIGPIILGTISTAALLAITLGSLGLAIGFVIKGFAGWTVAMKMISPTLTLFQTIIPLITTNMITLAGVMGVLGRAALVLKATLLAHPILAIGAALVSVYLYIKQLTPEWEKLNVKAEELRKEANKLSDGFNTLYEEYQNIIESSKEQGEAAIKLKDRLIELAKENENISEAALKAADSIDRTTGKIIDNGKALEEFNLVVVREQFEAMSAEATAASAKMEVAMRKLEFPTDSVSGFVRGLQDLNSLFFSFIPGIDTLGERYRKMNKQAEDAMKAGKAFAESQVRELVKLGQIDPSLGLRQFETFVKSLGPMSEQMASFYYDAFMKIKISQAEAAQAGAQIAKRSLEEQNVALQSSVAQRRATLLQLQDAYEKAAEAAEIDPKNIEAIKKQNEAYQQSLGAVRAYITAIETLRDNEIKIIQKAADDKISIIEDEVNRGILTKERGELEKVRILTEGAAAEADILKRMADEVANMVGKGSDEYSKMSAVAQKAATDIYIKQKEELDKYIATLRETYEKARNEVQKYAEEVIKWENKLAELNMTTEDKIRNARRKTMTEYESWLDMRKQAEEKAQAARAALEEGNFALAEKLAKQAESLYGNLATKIEEGTGEQKRVTLSIEEGTSAAIRGYGNVKNILEEVYIAQRDIAEDSKREWKEAADSIESALDDITATDRELDINIKLQGLTDAQDRIDDLTRDETKTITIITKEAKALGGAIGKFAHGGSLPGFGGGDRINILAEAGEYMVRKEAVRKYGLGFFEALNSMSFGLTDIGSSITKRLNKLQPRLGYQTGGEIAGLQNMGRLELAIGSNAYPVMAQVDVIKELKVALEKEGLMRTS